ncbi:acyl-CoA thioesterase [Leptospira ilyithenensis]|uniref:Acyl-CoA thioesterase n=1 Tax=Leptospira ilyithenensis TaxID=2484901 RepID=A0A4R9LJ03_9LEPT|nr:acyl-CoA thioesterase [Leptospira ilyithenensis]TGN06846.1 acyl-CoA thioesterase [Leptospira ilyithenensis]
MGKPVKYRHSYFQKVAWGEMDAFGHVNNVTYVRYFETARADYFTAESLWDSPLKPVRFGPVLTHLDMDYRKQVVFPATLEVSLEVDSISSRAFTVVCSMWNQNEDCVLTGHAGFIWFDFELQKPSQIPDVFREKFGSK